MSGVFGDLRVRGGVRTLAVVFGDQLDHESAALEGLDAEADAVLMMEVEEESTHVPSHRQRTVLFLSAMRHFALELRERGLRLEYVPLDDAANTQCFAGEIERAAGRLKPERVVCARPGEWRVLEAVRGLSERLDCELEVVPDNHFLVGLEEFDEWASGRRSMIMEHFYRWQRRRLGVLVDENGEPEGGEWNFDKENREPIKRAPRLRRPYTPRVDDVTRGVMELVEARLPDLPGRMERFDWPVTRTQARRALADFIEHRLPRFGTYEDAMWSGEATLYHSRLSPLLNLKLLRPMECVEAAVESYKAGAAPINAVEGFVRQIIGWREFIRGVYWREGPGYASRNGLEQEEPLPELYWSGETEMACVRECVGQVLDNAYGHHIQRLMITGNFALLMGVHPKAVSDWYLGMYADAVDWVTLPNTLGMAMHADGGVVGTKPYAASGNYIRRMSNYCDGCAYDPRKRTGDGACPFNALYWDFLIRQRERLGDNTRMALILKNVDRMKEDELVQITVEARAIRERAARGTL